MTNKIYLEGIFIQRVSTKHFKKFKGFCVTFPRLGNLHAGLEGHSIYPSNTFKTFFQAFNFALLMREKITLLRDCPIVNHCDFEANRPSSYSMQSKIIA